MAARRRGAGLHLAAVSLLALALCDFREALGQSNDQNVARESTARQAVVGSGRRLAKAFADPEVVEIVLKNSFVVSEEDWYGLGSLPIPVRRSVTVRGPLSPESEDDVPVLDLNFVKNKLRLATGVSLTIEGVVLTRFSERGPLPTLTLDIVDPRIGAKSEPDSYVWLLHTVINLRLCLPEALDGPALASLPRPAIWPGVQTFSGNIDQAGCSNDVGLPWLQQCWPARRSYLDIASGVSVRGSTGRQYRADYLIRAIDTTVLCSAVMPKACIEDRGVIGCQESLLPSLPVPPPLPPSPPSPQPPRRGAPPLWQLKPGMLILVRKPSPPCDKKRG